MRGSSTAWAKGVAALVALVTVLTFSAPPCDAGETPQGAPPKASEKRTLSASAAARVAAAPVPRSFAQDATAGATGESRSFFRTPTGVAAIVLMVAGAAYVGYKIPKDNGKVHSPIR